MHFGLHPWDVERLTYDEIRYYREALKEIAAEMRKARAKRR